MVDHKWNSTLTARRRQLQALVRLTLAPPHLEWPALHRELGRALSRAGRALEIGPPAGTHPSGRSAGALGILMVWKSRAPPLTSGRWSINKQ